jgi:uncharacterized protein YggE
MSPASLKGFSHGITKMKIATPTFAVLALGALLAAPAVAQESEPYPRIMVSGEGVSTLAPDMAIVNLTVTREAETAREALDANTEAMARVLAAMQQEGIEERDLQTSNFSIEPKIVYPKNYSSDSPEAPKIIGYTVRNSLTVRIRDMDRVGDILDTSVTLGVNQGGQISFTNDDPSEALNQARIKAMEEAIAKARTLAEAAGVGLGKVLEISENSYRPQPVPIARARNVAFNAAESAPVPVAAGENSYSVTVNVSFGIEQ